MLDVPSSSASWLEGTRSRPFFMSKVNLYYIIWKFAGKPQLKTVYGLYTYVYIQEIYLTYLSRYIHMIFSSISDSIYIYIHMYIYLSSKTIIQFCKRENLCDPLKRTHSISPSKRPRIQLLRDKSQGVNRKVNCGDGVNMESDGAGMGLGFNRSRQQILIWSRSLLLEDQMLRFSCWATGVKRWVCVFWDILHDMGKDLSMTADATKSKTSCF